MARRGGGLLEHVGVARHQKGRGDLHGAICRRHELVDVARGAVGEVVGPTAGVGPVGAGEGERGPGQGTAALAALHDGDLDGLVGRRDGDAALGVNAVAHGGSPFSGEQVVGVVAGEKHHGAVGHELEEDLAVVELVALGGAGLAKDIDGGAVRPEGAAVELGPAGIGAARGVGPAVGRGLKAAALDGVGKRGAVCGRHLKARTREPDQRVVGARLDDLEAAPAVGYPAAKDEEAAVTGQLELGRGAAHGGEGAVVVHQHRERALDLDVAVRGLGLSDDVGAAHHQAARKLGAGLSVLAGHDLDGPLAVIAREGAGDGEVGAGKRQAGVDAAVVVGTVLGYGEGHGLVGDGNGIPLDLDDAVGDASLRAGGRKSAVGVDVDEDGAREALVALRRLGLLELVGPAGDEKPAQAGAPVGARRERQLGRAVGKGSAIVRTDGERGARKRLALLAGLGKADLDGLVESRDGRAFSRDGIAAVGDLGGVERGLAVRADRERQLAGDELVARRGASLLQRVGLSLDEVEVGEGADVKALEGRGLALVKQVALAVGEDAAHAEEGSVEGVAVPVRLGEGETDGLVGKRQPRAVKREARRPLPQRRVAIRVDVDGRAARGEPEAAGRSDLGDDVVRIGDGAHELDRAVSAHDERALALLDGAGRDEGALDLEGGAGKWRAVSGGLGKGQPDRLVLGRDGEAVVGDGPASVRTGQLDALAVLGEAELGVRHLGVTGRDDGLGDLIGFPRNQMALAHKGGVGACRRDDLLDGTVREVALDGEGGAQKGLAVLVNLAEHDAGGRVLDRDGGQAARRSEGKGRALGVVAGQASVGRDGQRHGGGAGQAVAVGRHGLRQLVAIPNEQLATDGVRLGLGDGKAVVAGDERLHGAAVRKHAGEGELGTGERSCAVSVGLADDEVGLAVKDAFEVDGRAGGGLGKALAVHLELTSHRRAADLGGGIAGKRARLHEAIGAPREVKDLELARDGLVGNLGSTGDGATRVHRKGIGPARVKDAHGGDVLEVLPHLALEREAHAVERAVRLGVRLGQEDVRVKGLVGKGAAGGIGTGPGDLGLAVGGKVDGLPLVIVGNGPASRGPALVVNGVAEVGGLDELVAALLEAGDIQAPSIGVAGMREGGAGRVARVGRARLEARGNRDVGGGAGRLVQELEGGPAHGRPGLGVGLGKRHRGVELGVLGLEVLIERLPGGVGIGRDGERDGHLRGLHQVGLARLLEKIAALGQAVRERLEVLAQLAQDGVAVGVMLDGDLVVAGAKRARGPEVSATGPIGLGLPRCDALSHQESGRLGLRCVTLVQVKRHARQRDLGTVVRIVLVELNVAAKHGVDHGDVVHVVGPRLSGADQASDASVPVEDEGGVGGPQVPIRHTGLVHLVRSGV